MLLALRSRRLSVTFRSPAKPLSLDLYATPWASFPSRRSSLMVQRWPALKNPPPPAMTCVSSVIPHVELKYFSCADVTAFRSHSLAFLTNIVLRDPTTEERVFVFPKKRRGKKVFRIIFSTPANEFPVSQVTL